MIVMYKVLLVDDERMILDGISVIIDWESHQTRLVGKAMNGLEALAFIERNQPDIVITDITMPGLDGIGLVAKASEKYPSIKWVFLSGYNEFEYARQAMRFGVRHYLLKPCNEDQISEALTEIIQEKREEEEAMEYLESIQQDASKLHDYEYEDIVKRYIGDGPFSEDIQQRFINMVNSKFNGSDFQFLIFHCESNLDYPIIEQQLSELEVVCKGMTYIGTIIDSNIVIMLEKDERLLQSINTYLRRVTDSWSIVLSRPYQVKDAVKSKSILNDLILQLFYHPKGAVVSANEITDYQTGTERITPLDVDQVIVHLKKQSSIEQPVQIVKKFGNELKQYNISPKIAKGYFIQFYLLLMSRLNSVMQEDRIEIISKLEGVTHLATLYEFFDQLFSSLRLVDSTPRKYSKVVQDLLEWIDREIHNPELSLQWLANNCLYMNADYLGKIFKKEVGQRFSSYVTNARINKAVEIIGLEEDIKVFELAERLGFGSNPQYFSQLFKRIKGFTPSEVMKSTD
ncbi:response regulator [Gracilibacillus xinjiangensis]|uniref:Response regulator n=1 Tax=Gracilibacillus xinjiangensis TaxID=1193282 RepID=A0ABV8WYD3_9BACI